MRTSSTSTTRLAFSSTTPDSTIDPYVAMVMNSRTVMTNAAVSSSGLRPATEPSSTLSTGTGGHHGGQILAADSGGRRPLLHGDDLDRARDNATQLLVGVAAHSNCRASTTSTSTSPRRTASSPTSWER
jgi:hypothetical protein